MENGETVHGGELRSWEINIPRIDQPESRGPGNEGVGVRPLSIIERASVYRVDLIVFTRCAGCHAAILCVGVAPSAVRVD